MVHVLSNVGKGQSNHAPRSTLCKLKWLSFAGAFEIATSIALWRVRFGCHTFCCVTTKRLRLPMLIYDDLKVNSRLKSNSSWTHVNKHVLSTPRGNKQWHVHRIPVLHKPITPCSDVPVYCTGQNRLQNICSILVGVYQANRFFPRCMKVLWLERPSWATAWATSGLDRFWRRLPTHFHQGKYQESCKHVTGHKMNLCMALISIRTHHTARYFSM